MEECLYGGVPVRESACVEGVPCMEGCHVWRGAMYGGCLYVDGGSIQIRSIHYAANSRFYGDMKGTKRLIQGVP